MPRLAGGLTRGIALAVWVWAGGLMLGAPAPSYFTRSWQAEDGLPGNNVTAIVQTQDGYLWVGTRGGLARFDGVRFTRFDYRNAPEMHSWHVTSLFESMDGALWIGQESGELTRYEKGKFTSVPVPAVWRSGKISGIAADENGDPWLMNEAGELVRVRDGAVVAGPASVPHRVALVPNPRGGFWLQRDNEVSTFEHGQLKPLEFDGADTNRYVQGIGPSSDGGLWVMTDRRVLKWRGEQWVRDLGSVPWDWAPAHSVIGFGAGGLAAATVDHGLFLMREGQPTLQLCRTNAFSTDWITTLCRDREGNLWVGTGNGGLAVVRLVSFTTPSPPDQWQGRAVLSVTTAHDGAIWMGTEGSGLYRFQDGAWTGFRARNGIANQYVWSVVQDAAGRILAGTWGEGVFVQSSNRFELAPGFAGFTAPVASMLVSGQRVWIGTRLGLLRWEDGTASWLGRSPELFSPDVRAMCEAPDGTLWFGMYGGGLGRLQRGTLKQFRRPDGLSSDFVQCLRLDADGALWIGTFGGGLNRFKDGRFAVIGTAQGLPNETICDIEDDGRGNFWFSSHGGIFCVAREQLNGCADGTLASVHCLSYDRGDGLPTLECSGGFQPAGARTPDGRLWFPTSKGLVMVDPDDVKVNRLPPPVIIEDVLVDGRRVAGGADAIPHLRIQPGQNHFEFHYTALSFVRPERVRFKYRLDGLAKDWIGAADDGTKRMVTFSDIPPGEYTFHVIACNNDEVWNNDGATVAFTLLPYFWQTWWFRAAYGVLGATLAAGAVWFNLQRRMRLKLERLEHQRAVDRERERIAKDIHDDLGASLTRITMLSQSARSSLDNPSAAAATLNRIYSTARELTRALDEIVWAVDPKHDTLDSLATYLGKFALDFLRAADVRCRLDVPVQLPVLPLTAEVRHNLFLAVKEALHNAVKHAAASEVHLSLTLGPRVFAFAIADNGRGFVATPVADAGRIVHGYGLVNMRRRLEQVGGRCEIESSPGQGTKVKLTVPMDMSVSEDTQLGLETRREKR